MDSVTMEIRYQPPTPNEVISILSALHLTGAATGKLLDVGDRTVRRWTAGERDLGFAMLYTLLNRKIDMRIDPGNWRIIARANGLIDRDASAKI